ncbi:MAG: xanthine dehydrogenase family protein subunit M [Burkholderiaceae bacterium]
MKAAQFDYHRPGSLSEVLTLLAAGDGSAKLMSGGQSLGPMLNLRLTRPATVIDVSALAELRRVSAGADTIDIGAAVTHAEIEDGLHAPLRGHPVQQAAAGIAYRAVRNRGTIGGSLAHADPAADWIIVMTALGAELSLVSPRGTRRTAIDGFMQGAYTTVLAADELITAVHLPLLAADARWGYYKFCRKPGEFAETSAAVLVAPSTRTARVVLGALDGAPRQLPGLAAHIAGNGGADPDALHAAIRDALPELDAIDRKRHAAGLRRALLQAGLLREGAVA